MSRAQCQGLSDIKTITWPAFCEWVPVQGEGKYPAYRCCFSLTGQQSLEQELVENKDLHLTLDQEVLSNAWTYFLAENVLRTGYQVTPEEYSKSHGHWEETPYWRPVIMDFGLTFRCFFTRFESVGAKDLS